MSRRLRPRRFRTSSPTPLGAIRRHETDLRILDRCVRSHLGAVPHPAPGGRARRTYGPLRLVAAHGLGTNSIALVVTLLWTGIAGVKQEVGRLRLGRGSARWLILGAAIPALATAMAVWSGRAAGESRPFTPSSAIPMMIIFQIITGAVGEELGWRGFLLPRLGKRLGALKAAWLMAVLWSLWHVAAFYFPGTPQYQLIPPVPFLRLHCVLRLLPGIYLQSHRRVDSAPRSLPTCRSMFHWVLEVSNSPHRSSGGYWSASLRHLLSLRPELDRHLRSRRSARVKTR